MWLSGGSLGGGSRGCRACEDALETTDVGPGTAGRGEGEGASDTVRGQSSKKMEIGKGRKKGTDVVE